VILIVLLATATFATLSLQTPQAQAATTLVAGVNYMSSGNAWSESDATLKADFQRFANDGVKEVSIRVMWSVMMPSSSGLSSTALSNIKRVLTIADSYGIKVNLDFWTQFGYTLGFPTSWAGKDYYSLLSNPTKGYYLSYMKNVVNELKGYNAIKSWAILNEPYYSSSSQKAPFQTLMADCVQAIKSVDSTHDVVCRFTLSYTPGSGKYDSSVYDLFDAMAVTEYLDPSNPSDTRYNGRWSYWDKTVADCKARNLPLWVIEFGDDNTSTEHVRQHYELSLQKFASAGVVKAYAWAWQTRSASNEAFNIYSGSSPDPAYYELAKYPATGSGITPTPTPSATATPKPTVTPTPTATATATPRPTTTPSPTPTATPRPTTTATPTPTPTPTPTIPSTGSLSYPQKGDIAYGSTTSAYKPWTLKEDCVPEFIALANKYGGSYESIGKSSNGEWDIIMFKFGNPNGAKIMIDAQLHGNEFYGYETLYALATWLLTSNDPQAKEILQNNYVLMVPVVDYRWGRTNYNSPSWMTTNDPGMDGGDCGVNLNRNFSPGWSSSLSTSNTDAYSGVAANSEAESKALINAWTKYRPQIYWNLHQGASPMTSCSATTTLAKTDANKVKSLLPGIQSSLGVTSGWSFSVGSGGSGYAKDGAAAQGAAGFLTEVMTGWDNSASKLTDLTSGNTFKQVKAMFIAMCTAISGSTTTTPTPTATTTPAPTTTPTPTSPATTVVFTDSFDNGAATGWTSTIRTSGETTTIGSFTPHTGAYNARFTSTGSATGIENAYYAKNTNLADAYARGYIRIAGSTQLTDEGDKFSLIRFTDGSQSLANVGVKREGGVNKWMLYGAGQTVTSSVTVSTERWYSIEVHYNAAQGLAELYVDGTKVLQLTVNTHNTATHADFGLISSTYVQNPVTIYGDCFKISSQYIGTE
jgi:hypothetical protein